MGTEGVLRTEVVCGWVTQNTTDGDIYAVYKIDRLRLTYVHHRKQ
jgi:hypothetical protein